jgi:hypothetical protein
VQIGRFKLLAPVDRELPSISQCSIINKIKEVEQLRDTALERSMPLLKVQLGVGRQALRDIRLSITVFPTKVKTAGPLPVLRTPVGSQVTVTSRT